MKKNLFVDCFLTEVNLFGERFIVSYRVDKCVFNCIEHDKSLSNDQLTDLVCALCTLDSRKWFRALIAASMTIIAVERLRNPARCHSLLFSPSKDYYSCVRAVCDILHVKNMCYTTDLTGRKLNSRKTNKYIPVFIVSAIWWGFIGAIIFLVPFFSLKIYFLLRKTHDEISLKMRK